MRQLTLIVVLILSMAGIVCRMEKDCTTEIECLHTYYNYSYCDLQQNQTEDMFHEISPLIAAEKKEQLLTFSICEYKWQITENERVQEESVADQRNQGRELSALIREKFPQSLICFN